MIVIMMTHSLLLYIMQYIQYINIITQSWILSGMWERKRSQKSVDGIIIIIIISFCIMYHHRDRKISNVWIDGYMWMDCRIDDQEQDMWVYSTQYLPWLAKIPISISTFTFTLHSSQSQDSILFYVRISRPRGYPTDTYAYYWVNFKDSFELT